MPWFMGVHVEVTTESPHDEWESRLEAAIKTAAVNSGLMPRLKFEQLAYPDGKVPNVPEFAQMSQELFVEMGAARALARRRL